jgi:ATP-dependent Clp protease ATP-binding subunit ClpA
MLEHFSDSARRVVALAEEEADRLGHPHAGTEHLLLGLLGEEGTPAAALLATAGVTLVAAREKVIEAVGPSAAGPGPGRLALTARAQRALDRAARFSRQRGDERVGTEDVLAGVLDVEGRAGQVLRGLGVDIAALGDAVTRGRTRPTGPADPGRTVPHCPRCHADLTTGLSHRAVTSRGDPEGRSRVPGERALVVAFCAACGSALGVVSP